MFKRQILASLMFGAAVASTAWSPSVLAQPKKASAIEVIETTTSVLSTPGSTAATLRNYNFSLKQLGMQQPFQLRGIDPVYSVPFSVPADEVVTGIKLKLDFSYSPSLLTNLSHLKVMLNGEVAQTIALPKEQAGNALSREIAIDPRLISDFNRLSFQFVGHYTLDCEDPFHSSLWLNLSNASSLHFTVAPLSVVNDLAMLPVPFFDRRDSRRLERPFVFGANPSTSTLEAAGIVASWFGEQASYRGAMFPAHLNKLPSDNIVVFATNADKPQGLLDIPAISGPTISIGQHPQDSRFKVLYVLGRDAAELRMAATTLGLGHSALAGQTASNLKLDAVRTRKPYDAPRWVPSDRPVKFGELATTEELNVRGLMPDLVRINMITPPDLFAWKSSGVPVDLRFRYTPRPRADKSNLNVLANERYATSFPLLAYPGSNAPDSKIASLISKLGPDELLPVREKFHMPVNLLRSRSQMQFHFSFDYPKEGACRDVVLDNVRASVDPESELDISKFPHYIKMPDVSAFANTGFPFTRMADLSETAVVMPNNYTASDIATYLTLMGRMGDSTGLPAYGVTVTSAADVQSVAKKDLLLLGGVGNQPLLRDWAGNMPFAADGSTRAFNLMDTQRNFMTWYESPKSDALPTANLSATTLTRDALLFGFESPLSSGRSVVAITSDKPTGQADILGALMDTEVIAKIQGGLSIIKGKTVESMASAQPYFVGSLPPLMALRWFLSQHAWLAVLALMALMVVVAGILYTWLRVRAGQRVRR